MAIACVSSWRRTGRTHNTRTLFTVGRKEEASAKREGIHTRSSTWLSEIKEKSKTEQGTTSTKKGRKQKIKKGKDHEMRTEKRGNEENS